MNFLKMLFNDVKNVFISQNNEDYAIYIYKGVYFKWVRFNDLSYTYEDAKTKCGYLQRINNNWLYKVDSSY